jgi:hypothetical protein
MVSRRNPAFVVLLTLVMIGVVFCLLPSRLDATVTQWWSADLQPTNVPADRSYTGTAGDVWNAIGAVGYTVADPSWALVDNMGNADANAPVTFAISGTVGFYSSSYIPNTNPVGCDYLFYSTSGITTIGYSFSGLTPGGKYELTIIGGGMYSWPVDIRVDTNGNGDLNDETAVNLVGSYYSTLLPAVPLHDGLIMLAPPEYNPPYTTFLNITAGSGGVIACDQVRVSLEGNISGFQLRAISDVVWLPGDADRNGTVDGADLNTVLSNYNQSFTVDPWSMGDFDGNGTVDGADLNTVLSNYNQHSSAAGAPGAPEPSTLLLAAAGLAGLLAYGWRKRR